MPLNARPRILYLWNATAGRRGIPATRAGTSFHVNTVTTMIRTKEPRTADDLGLDELTAEDIMNTEILTISESWPVSYLAEFLTENSISGGPVVSEDGKLVGVVSATDIVRYDSFPNREPDRHATQMYYHHALENAYSDQDLTSFRFASDTETKVREIMTQTIFSVDAEASVKQIANTMVTGRIHRVLVTRRNELVGIISALDVLRILANGD